MWSNTGGRVERVAGHVIIRALVVCSLLGMQAVGPALAATDCTVVNLMPPFWQALAAAEPAIQMRAGLVDLHPELYNDDYVRLPAGAAWAEKLARERAYDESHRTEITATEDYLAANVPGYMRAFSKTFPAFRCDFTFYIAPSFGNMDGSAATVRGQHRIIFAPDVIPRYHRLDELKVLIDHETFHIYHHQATGVFGASEEAIPTVQEALWSEGLATFASWRMNPGVSLDAALLQPGIPEGARVHLAAIAADLLAHLDDKDAATFAHYFEAGEQPAGYPPRAGYYVGVLIAESLSQRYTLSQMAKLRGPGLHDAILARLRRLCDCNGVTDPGRKRT